MLSRLISSGNHRFSFGLAGPAFGFGVLSRFDFMRQSPVFVWPRRVDGMETRAAGQSAKYSDGFLMAREYDGTPKVTE